jgi:hypothetical protein
MMPSNTPPPDDEKSANADEAPQQPTNPFARHNLLLQLMATRQPQGRQRDNQQHEAQGTSGAMISNLNENMAGYHHYQQHGSLQHQQHEAAQAHSEASYRDALAQMPGLPQQPHMQDMSATPGSAMQQFHGATLQTNSLGQFSNRFNPNQGQADDDLLSMMLMASRQKNAPSVFNTLLNNNEHGESSSMNDTDMLRAYNQSLTQALIASANHPQQQNFGEATAMPPQFLGAHAHLPGLRQTNMLMHNPPFSSMYHATSQAGHDRGVGHDQQFGEGGFPGGIPERIEPSPMGSSVMGRHTLSDIPHGIPQQRHLEHGVGEKRPYESLRESGEARKSAPTRKKRRPQRKKPIDMPRRPLSAYNLFFSAERERILKEIETQEGGGAVVPEGAKEEGEDTAACQALQRPLVQSKVKRRPHRKTHGKIGFRNLAQTVGQRWKQLNVQQKKHYQDLADNDMSRHKDAMEEYYKKQNEEKNQSLAEGEEGEEKDKEEADNLGSDAEEG